MKNDTINFILICIAYFAIGLILAGNYMQDKSLKLTRDSVNRLIMIEIITEQQFNLLQERVQDLEKKSRSSLTIVDTVVY
jgi:hypothetical protein